MNWWKKILIVSLAAVCFGCQGPVKKTEQVQPSMEEEIRKVEAAAITEKAAKAAPEEVPTMPEVEPAPAAEAAPDIVLPRREGPDGLEERVPRAGRAAAGRSG